MKFEINPKREEQHNQVRQFAAEIIKIGVQAETISNKIENPELRDAGIKVLSERQEDAFIDMIEAQPSTMFYESFHEADKKIETEIALLESELVNINVESSAKIDEQALLMQDMLNLSPRELEVINEAAEKAKTAKQDGSIEAELDKLRLHQIELQKQFEEFVQALPIPSLIDTKSVFEVIKSLRGEEVATSKLEQAEKATRIYTKDVSKALADLLISSQDYFYLVDQELADYLYENAEMKPEDKLKRLRGVISNIKRGESLKLFAQLEDAGFKLQIGTQITIETKDGVDTKIGLDQSVLRAIPLDAEDYEPVSEPVRKKKAQRYIYGDWIDIGVSKEASLTKNIGKSAVSEEVILQPEYSNDEIVDEKIDPEIVVWNKATINAVITLDELGLFEEANLANDRINLFKARSISKRNSASTSVGGTRLSNEALSRAEKYGVLRKIKDQRTKQTQDRELELWQIVIMEIQNSFPKLLSARGAKKTEAINIVKTEIDKYLSRNN